MYPKIVSNLSLPTKAPNIITGMNKLDIAQTAKNIELIGFITSFLLLTISLIILHVYKSLHKLKTYIHRNIFIAMNIQVMLNLIVYSARELSRLGTNSVIFKGMKSIEEMPNICIGVYVIIEYFNMAMFAWMFLEGLYLNTLTTTNERNNNPFMYFWIIGWIAALFVTGSWYILALMHYSASTSVSCWHGYSFLPQFWVVQGPRLSVILINFLYLLNTIRVLVIKLSEDNTADVIMARKAVKAAIIVLPILGITSILGVFEGPISGPIWRYALWTYSTTFLRAFQGALIAIIYCFFNGEVLGVLTSSLSNQITIFRHRYPRLARFFHLPPQRRRRPSADYELALRIRHGDYPMRALRVAAPQSQQPGASNSGNVAETAFVGIHREKGSSNVQIHQIPDITRDIRPPSTIPTCSRLVLPDELPPPPPTRPTISPCSAVPRRLRVRPRLILGNAEQAKRLAK